MKIKSLIAVLLLTASNVFAQIPSYVPTNGLVGWWPFNGNANDESGNGNNGVVNGATTTIDRFGSTGKAYSFNGVSDFINCGNSSLLNQNNITISIWANHFQYPQTRDHTLFSKGRFSNGEIGYRATISSDKQVYFIWSVDPLGGDFVNSTNIQSLNQWDHYVFIKNNDSLRIYINGTLNNLLVHPRSNLNNSSPLFIGVNRDPTFPLPSYVDYWNGKIDDIGIWNRALTQQEITDLYNSQTCNSSFNTITADGITTFCAGNYVNLTSDVVGGTYQWKKNGVNITTNATSRTYKATATGSYTCVATCNGTALTSNAIAVTSKTNASASVTATGATSFCAGDSVTLNCTNLGSNYSVQWYRTNISMENATAYSQVVKQPGTYKVVTKNLTNGCSRISGSSAVVAVSCRLANPDVIAADITESDFDAATREAEPKGKIYIYPNPTSDNKFTVELLGLEVDGNATLEVYNGMGQLLSSEKVNITNGSLNRTIQIDEQSKGQLCLVRLIAGSEVYDSKVILK